jgi:uncharacterized OB-fold protein
MYCIDCFLGTDKFVPVGPRGRVEAISESWIDFEGKRLKEPRMVAFVAFKGVTGGIIHAVEGKGLKIGSAVVPRFAPQSERKGSLLDIESFVAATP